MTLNTDKFDQFWAAYPHKVGKGDARKAWKQVKGDQHFDAIMAGIQPYMAHVEANTWLNWKHPASWLRAERWEDEYAHQPQQQAISTAAQSFLDGRMKRRQEILN